MSAAALHDEFPAIRDWYLGEQELASVGTVVARIVNVLGDPPVNHPGANIGVKGSFVSRLEEDGRAGPLVRVIAEDSQFQQIVPTHDGNFLIAGDQGPLQLAKVTPEGKVLWKRLFSSQLCLPDLALLDDDTGYVAAHGYSGSSLHLLRLNANGRVVNRIPIHAGLGAVATGPNRTCALLYCKGSFPEPRVLLAGFDSALRRLWTTQTPFDGRGGRTFGITARPDGYLAIGEDQTSRKLLVARFDALGKMLWSDSSLATLAPAASKVIWTSEGFYLVFSGSLGPDRGFRVVKIQVD